MERVESNVVVAMAGEMLNAVTTRKHALDVEDQVELGVRGRVLRLACFKFKVG